MPLSIECPNCNRSYRVSEDSLGARAQCKHCQHTFTISFSADETFSPKPDAAVPAEAEGKPAASAPESPADASQDQSKPPTTSEASSPLASVRSSPGGSRAGLSQPSVKASGLERGAKLGEYVVKEQLGAGAMGEVWLAHDRNLKRDVAIKVLPVDYAKEDERLQRFIREARLAARLHHTNAVTVYQVGTKRGLVFIAMEFVEGSSLDKIVQADGPLDWREATKVIRDAAAGLAAAHEISLVHRDVKPANLMRTKKGVTKVVDFGLARAQLANTQLTQQGAVLGTPAYMAPEQWIGQQVDGRSDLYSLICTYYFLLTGQLPFDAPSLPALGYQHRYEPLPDPRKLVSNLPNGVCRILARGSQKEPDQRYASCDELVAELDALLAVPEDSLTYQAPWAELAGSVDDGTESTLLEEPKAGLLGEVTTQVKSQVKSGVGAAGRLLRRTSERTRLPTWTLVAAAAAVLGVLLGVTIVLRTNTGTVKLVLSDPEAEVTVKVDGDSVDIEGPDLSFKYKSGEYKLEVTSDKYETCTQELDVKRGQDTEVTITLEPKSGHAGRGTTASEMAQGTDQSSPTPKEIASSEEPSELPPEPPEGADQIRARRDQTLSGLSEKSLDSLIRELLASGMMPMGPGMMPMDPRMMPMDPRMMPPFGGTMGPGGLRTNPMAGAGPGRAQIPDRFVLVGKLGAVRAVDGKTWVYLWSENPATVPGMQPPPPVIGIEMENEGVAQWMADYRLDDMVRVVAKSETWVAGAPPAVRVFKAPSGRPVGYWFFRGEGLEKASEQGTTWIDAQFGRAQTLGNLQALKRSPGFLFRNQSSLAGTTVRLTAQFHSVARRGNGLRVHLSVPDSVEGPIPVVVSMGGGAKLKQFLDYKRGATVEAEIILQRFLVKDVNYPKRSNGQPTPVETAATSPGAVPPMYTSATLDPLTGWAALTATGRQLQLQGDPSSLITTDGPSRQMGSIGGRVTPDVAHADSDAVGKEVVWSGTLSQVRAQDGETHVLVATSGESIFGLESFEVFTSDPDFVDELVDYREDGGSQDRGDAVSVTGVVCAADAAKVRLKSGVPLVEIRQIERQGDPQSRAIVGQKRDPSTLRADAVADGLSVVLRKEVTPRTVVNFVAEFTSYQTSNHSVLVNPKVSRYSRAEIFFPTSNRNFFADYRARDLVEVTAALGEQPDRPRAILKLTGKAIVRKANPRSLVTDQGREIPALDFSVEKRQWMEARTASSTNGRASKNLRACGVFVGFTKGESYYNIKIERLFLDGHTKLELLCGADAEARLFLEQLQSGDEVLFEFSVAKNSKTSQATYHLRWMSRIGEPDKKVTFPTARVR